MYRVMTIDDDVLVLKYLRDLLDWDELDLQITHETYSSVLGLEYFRKHMPDIVITDIGLPQIDGLELAHKFRSIKPDIVLIFLTCHEEFQYAKQAFQLEAVDYLIKDELTSEQLRASLQKAVIILQTQKANQEETPYKEDIYRHRDLLKRVFLDRFLNGDCSKENMDYGSRLGIVWTRPRFIVGMLFPYYSSYEPRYKYQDPLAIYGVYNIASELQRNDDGMSVIPAHQGVLLIYNYKPSLHINAMDKFRQFASKVMEKSNAYLKLRLCLYYFASNDGLADLSSAVRLMKERPFAKAFYFASAMVDIGTAKKEASANAPNTQLHLQSAIDALAVSVEERNAAEIKRQLQSLVTVALDKKIEPVMFLQSLQEFVLVIDRKQLANVSRAQGLANCLQDVKKADDAIQMIGKYLNEIIEMWDKSNSFSDADLKLQAINQYLLEHLSENLTSLDVAKFLHLNPSYFSRYFKKLTGATFTDYMHMHKTEIAGKLLERPEASIEGVTMALGFSDRNYFTKIFKRYMGMTPGEYMQQKQKRRT